MHRRDLLRSAAAAAALTLLPADAHAAWLRVRTLESNASDGRADDEQSNVFSAAQAALIKAMADTIIPRTATPGANDVGVFDFISVIVGENYSAQESSAFTTGLDAIDALAKTMGGSEFAALGEAARKPIMEALEKPTDRNTPAVRGYTRLKSLIVNGYFTSERVQKEVLHTNIMPGRYDGSAPFVARKGAP